MKEDTRDRLLTILMATILLIVLILVVQAGGLGVDSHPYEGGCRPGSEVLPDLLCVFFGFCACIYMYSLVIWVSIKKFRGKRKVNKK